MNEDRKKQLKAAEDALLRAKQELAHATASRDAAKLALDNAVIAKDRAAQKMDKAAVLRDKLLPQGEIRRPYGFGSTQDLVCIIKKTQKTATVRRIGVDYEIKFRLDKYGQWVETGMPNGYILRIIEDEA